MKVKKVKPAPNILDRLFCSKCGKELPIKHYTNEHGIPCADPRICEWNYCPNCGEIIEKEGEFVVTE